MTKRIAMWSGPRTVSTAMMRSWENRPDTAVWDEPFYGPYLIAVETRQPAAKEIANQIETDWKVVVDQVLGPVPDGRQFFFQKHMSHHLLPHIDRQWMLQISHFLLIREPREVITSYLRRVREPNLEDLGFLQLVDIYDWLSRETGRAPTVLDSKDLLENPSEMLRSLCVALDVPFLDEMLAWPPGRRPSDGIWAQYWYDAVEKSTTFQPYRPKNETVSPELQPILRQCDECYSRLHNVRLKPLDG